MDDRDMEEDNKADVKAEKMGLTIAFEGRCAFSLFFRSLCRLASDAFSTSYPGESEARHAPKEGL
jgi:hypothetical protein